MASKRKLYSTPANKRVLELIPQGVRTILDIGCGTGELAKHLSGTVVVDGITSSEREKALAEQVCRNVWLQNLENGLPEIAGQYDVIVMSHVLEHISDPGKLMSGLRRILADRGCAVCAIPNMLFLYNRLKLLVGRVEYEEYGLMDYTHVRWYTRKSIVELFDAYGFELESTIDNGNVPLGPIRKVLPKRAQSAIDRNIVNILPGLLSWEFIHRFTSRKVADVRAE